jgi:N-acylneuraminate cytidylyltransferase
MTKEKVIAFVPMRSGSKGIIDKNIKEINSMPLFYWMISALLESVEIDRVIVSTDSNEYAKLVRTYCPKAEIVYRSKENSSDDSSTESAVIEFLESNPQLEGSILLAQLTSPIVTSEDVDEFINYAKVTPEESSLSVVSMSDRFIWDRTGLPKNYNPLNRSRRQDLKIKKEYLVENGMFYYNSIQSWRNSKCRIIPPCGIFEMSKETILEIDTEEDFRIIESIMRSIF